MPRIRSLKPEHKSHRKVGQLSDFEYRLWVGLITEADDEGRLVAELPQLRALIFPYQPTLNLDLLESALAHLAKVGLLTRYVVRKTHFCAFASWKDHQRVNRPTPSNLPPPKHSLKPKFSEDSLSPHGGLTADRSGSERSGTDRKGGESEGREPATARLRGAPAPRSTQERPDSQGNQDPALSTAVAEFMATVRAAADRTPPPVPPPRGKHEAV